ncbi:EAL domain-containing protein [Neptunomonas antarctica]|uniref:PAS domain S-box-containing protein/diguanylate cyclase (GGDEF) domain-containing protein n=1 Tax=Neptunomonas antarctica TaxID=619304 RepID=A0A1N7ND58_9GAMM|nr:EAL domain-containing protein [Neptunomonas antarctica]SIS96325.1 PAS domain S-box-containing protein/diguanylate cyclase (GGDEF) domain-containing protein [Neptunomonas antarctica]
MKLNTKSLLLMMLILLSAIVYSDQTKTLIVGSEQDFPPFATGMTDSTAGGFTVDFWKAVAAEARLKYSIRVLPFREALQEFKEGRIDVLINLAISDERRQFADFSVPHVIVNGAIFVRNDNTSIQSEDDLSGQSIIVLNADLAQDYAISKGWAKQLVLVDTVEEGLKLLASGKHDAMLLSKLVGMQSLQLLGLTNIKPLRTPVGFSQKFAFALPKGQSQLLSHINEAMAVTNTNGIYTEIYNKWFGVYEVKEPTLRELSIYISPLIAIFLAVSGYFYYRRQIERKQAEEKLKLAASVFTNSREGIIITDAEGSIIEVNDTFTDITGFSREESIGRNPRFLQSGRQLPEFYISMWKTISTTGQWYGEVWNKRKNGEVYPEILTIFAVHNDAGELKNYMALFGDISVMKSNIRKLEHIAHYDLLTNLPNRSLLTERLSKTMLTCSRHAQSLAVVCLDLDGFKHVNDGYGHNVGDELLIALSLRMKNALRKGDTLARIGGDEFIAILVDLTSAEDCQPVLERLLLAASKPITVGDVIFNTSASIGVTLYPQDSVDADQLIRHADQAMYVAKESGKNRYHIFDTDQDDAVKAKNLRLKAIRSALDNHQFVLHYQPKVNMRTGTVIGVEALIRWQHPERGLLNPIEFLPVIENHAMSIELGEWVIATALSQISQWQEMELNIPLSISVNIAAVQLQQCDFTARLAILLATYPDVEPHYLELEVLETSALDDVQHVSEIMDACIALGVKFALDDFGTGYSSLTYLRRLPASLIKIDQSFVRDMLNDAGDLAIVEGVIALAKLFKREVIAEGVESIEHGRALLQLGCELAQGYGIARPMPASDFPAWISDWKPDISWQD